MERVALVGRLEAGHQHPEVAHVVGRIRLADAQEEAAFGGINTDSHPPRLGRHERRRTAEIELALAVIQDDVLAARVVPAFDRAKARFGEAPRRQPAHPPALVEIELGSMPPGLARLLADPLAREAEHVNKRKLCVPIGGTVQVHAQSSAGRRTSRLAYGWAGARNQPDQGEDGAACGLN